MTQNVIALYYYVEKLKNSYKYVIFKLIKVFLEILTIYKKNYILEILYSLVCFRTYLNVLIIQERLLHTCIKYFQH